MIWKQAVNKVKVRKPLVKLLTPSSWKGARCNNMVFKQANVELMRRAKWNAMFAMYELERIDGKKPDVWYLGCL